MSLNHPIREAVLLDFATLLPEQILPDYQSTVTGIEVRVVDGTPGRTLKLELKDGDKLRWQQEAVLDGGPQVLNFDLPPTVGKVNHFVWVLDNASPGDTVVLERVSLTATSPITDTATRAFVWSYGQLLNNWNPTTGQLRDKAHDASGEFDATQTAGSLAAATAQASAVGHRFARRRRGNREPYQPGPAGRDTAAITASCRTLYACQRPGPLRLCRRPNGARWIRSSPPSVCSPRKAVWDWIHLALRLCCGRLTGQT